MPASKLKLEIARVLKESSFIQDYRTLDTERGHKVLRLVLKYASGGQPVIRELMRVSSPGLRRYVGVAELPRVRNGLGMAIVSTSKGLMTDRQARQSRQGGELIAERRNSPEGREGLSAFLERRRAEWHADTAEPPACGEVPLHEHVISQGGVVLEGSIHLRYADGSTTTLRAGSAGKGGGRNGEDDAKQRQAHGAANMEPHGLAGNPLHTAW